jgi:hypothetical protein
LSSGDFFNADFHPFLICFISEEDFGKAHSCNADQEEILSGKNSNGTNQEEVPPTSGSTGNSASDNLSLPQAARPAHAVADNDLLPCLLSPLILFLSLFSVFLSSLSLSLFSLLISLELNEMEEAKFFLLIFIQLTLSCGYINYYECFGAN